MLHVCMSTCHVHAHADAYYVLRGTCCVLLTTCDSLCTTYHIPLTAYCLLSRREVDRGTILEPWQIIALALVPTRTKDRFAHLRVRVAKSSRTRVLGC